MNLTALKIRSTNPFLWMLLSLSIALYALAQANLYWGAIALCFTALVYLVYRQYLDDARARSQASVRESSGLGDQPENYVHHLEQIVGSLEKRTAELHESQEKFRKEAYYDALTGLPTRKLIIESMNRLLDGTGQGSTRFGILCLNLNRFRMINESLGHGTGDRIIKQVAKRISESIGEGDIVGHFGGDEFAVILADVEDPTGAIRTADEIAARVAECVRFKSREVYTSVSVGIVFASGEYKRAEDILRDADIAMYNAKDNAKKWVIFDRAMYARTVERQQLETDLRYAIVCNELEMFYQPIVRLEDASLSGFEALVRWNHPKRGLVSPTEFIPVAESTGLIGPMSIEILKNSCAQLSRWERDFELRGRLMMSVNLSAANLSDPKLIDQINEILNETGIQPASLKLEITESAVMKNADTAIESMKSIKETGVSLSIDDFGTGYSSLSYLQKFPIDYLKIDRSFVSAMENGDENEEIVRTIIALSKALKLSVVAEGIETKLQFEKLKELGCEFGQGYFFARPLPASAVEAFLKEDGAWPDLITADMFSSFGPDEPIHLDTTH